MGCLLCSYCSLCSSRCPRDDKTMCITAIAGVVYITYTATVTSHFICHGTEMVEIICECDQKCHRSCTTSYSLQTVYTLHSFERRVEFRCKPCRAWHHNHLVLLTPLHNSLDVPFHPRKPRQQPSKTKELATMHAMGDQRRLRQSLDMVDG